MTSRTTLCRLIVVVLISAILAASILLASMSSPLSSSNPLLLLDEENSTNSEENFSSCHDIFSRVVCNRDVQLMQCVHKNDSRYHGEFVLRKRTSTMCDRRFEISSHLINESFTVSSEMRMEIERTYGPDEYRMLMDGPEIMVLWPVFSERNDSNCEYRFAYTVAIPGSYYIQIFLIHERYGAFLAGQPERVEDLLGGAEVLVNIGNTTANSEALTSEYLRYHETLPLCPYHTSSPPSGRYVSLKRMPTPYKVNRTHSTPLAFHSNMSDESSILWLVDSCRYAVMSSSAIERCVRSKRVLLVGDSHMKRFYDGLVGSFRNCVAVHKRYFRFHSACSCLHEKETNRTISRDDALRSSNPLFAFYWDPLGINETHGLAGAFHDIPNWDIVIANYGVHPFSARGQWSLVHYEESLRNYTSTVKKLLKPSSHFLWHSSVGAPVTKEFYLGDFRSNSKMRYANELARRVLAAAFAEERDSLRFDLIDHHSPSVILLEHSPDNSHLPLETFQKPMRQILWHHICGDGAT